jgi:hypothetical protein
MSNLQKILDEIQEAAKFATKGPWEPQGRAYNTCVSPVGEVRNIARLGDPLDLEAWKNAEFIALARTALPKLAEAVYHVLDLLDVVEKSDKYSYDFGGNKAPSLVTTNEVRRAITDVFEDSADGQALDQARAEDDGTRITLDKYLEDDDD